MVMCVYEQMFNETFDFKKTSMNKLETQAQAHCGICMSKLQDHGRKMDSAIGPGVPSDHAGVAESLVTSNAGVVKEYWKTPIAVLPRNWVDQNRVILGIKETTIQR